MERAHGLGWLAPVALVLSGLLAPAAPAGAGADIDLPEGYVQDLVHGSGAAGPVVSSYDGTVYMRYEEASGVTRVARLDVARGSLVDVFEAPPWSSVEWLVGGPGSSFFMSLDGVITRVEADGSTSPWSTGPLGAAPLAYGTDGRMIGIAAGATEVVEIHPDGTTTTLLGGRSAVYDLVVAADGTIYVSDFPAEELVELAVDGSTRVVTAIAPDNTDLALDGEGRLYLNNAAVGFNRVDLATGALTPITAPAAPCSAIASPAEVTFNADGRAVFFSWVEHEVTWADPMSGGGGFVLDPTWANTTAADLGPDGALYVGVSGCGTTEASVQRFDPGLGASTRASGAVGSVFGLAVTDSGGVFVAGGTETFAGLYHAPHGSDELALVPGTGPQDIGALAAYPSGEEVLAYVGADPAAPGSVRIGRFSASGMVAEYSVVMPEPVQEFTLDISPDGTVYAQASEAARFFVGPVKRWLLRLDLEAGTSQEVFRHDRQGCCPFDNFAVDFEGFLWWVLNPDFVVYRVDLGGAAELFARQTPVDAGYVNRNAAGDVLMNAPEGVYRVWQAGLAERIAMVRDTVDELVEHGALQGSRAQLLEAHLRVAATAAGAGRAAVAHTHVCAFRRAVERFDALGVLDQRPLAYLTGRLDELDLSC